MTRYGPQFGPDFTFLGVPECDLDDDEQLRRCRCGDLGSTVRWGYAPIAPVPGSDRRPSG